MKDQGSLPTDWRPLDSTFIQHLAHVLASQNRESQAADLLEYVLAKDPNNGEAMKALTGVYFMMGHHDQAARMAERALKMRLPDQDAAAVQMIQARALHALGQSEEAERLMAAYLRERNIS